MKQITIIFFCLLFLTSCNGQTKKTNYAETIKSQVEIMGQYLLKNDFNSFSKYTYPRIIEMMGGKQKMVEVMEKGLKEMKSEGTGFLNLTFGEPSKIIRAGKEIQATISETITMKVPNGKLIIHSTLIAISVDQGKNWYFIDTSGKDILTMKKALPNLNEELIIPEKTQPIFYPN